MQQQNNHPGLDGRVALVTGGGSGIGRAAALAYAQAGATVLVSGRGAAAVEETAALIAAAGGVASARVADVSVEGLTGADFDEVVGTSLKGVWLCIKYELEAMRAGGRGGAIVNTSSWLARKPVAGAPAYAASKGGLDAMVQALAQEAGPDGIRINNVCPGVIDTPMYRRLGDEATLARFAAVTPLRRSGLPADIGEVAVWPGTDAARFVTGHSLMVDGGYTLATA